VETEFLACPNCGSELFIEKVPGKQLVFRVDAQWTPIYIEEDIGQGVSGKEIDPSALRCGACSWRGEMEDLVPSHG
jgi:hypothetical protein